MSNELTTTSSHMIELIETSKMLHKSNIFPHIKSAEAAFAIVQYGSEIGVGPMVALQSINFIQGKPVCSGQLLLSQAYKLGVTMSVVQQDDKACELVFERNGFAPLTSRFTMEDAKAAGLAGKDNWRKYPKDMLFWRAVSSGIRRIAPDAATNAYTPDEMTEGKIIDVTAEVVNTVTGEVRGGDDKMQSGSVTDEQWKYIAELRNSREIGEALDAELVAWSCGAPTAEQASEWIDMLKGLPKKYDRATTMKWVEKSEPKAYRAILKVNKNAVDEARLKYLGVDTLEESDDEHLKLYATHIKERLDETKAKKESK